MALTPVRTTIPLTAALAVALLAAGCGSSSPTTGAGRYQGLAGAAYRYSACMRTHGVPNFPDPKVSSHGGSTSISMVVGPSIIKTPQGEVALRECKGLLPGPGSGPASSPQQTAHLLAFAKCMRAHRVPSFPDPDSQGRITREMISAAGIDLRAPAVQAAAYACVPASHGAVTAAGVHRALTGGP